MDSDDSDEFNSFSEELAVVKRVMVVIKGLNSSQGASIYCMLAVRRRCEQSDADTLSLRSSRVLTAIYQGVQFG